MKSLRLRISNPRKSGRTFFVCGLQIRRDALRARVSSCRLAGSRFSLPPCGLASPLAVRRLRRSLSPLGVPADLQSADKKGSTYLTADLQSASSENAQRRNEKPTAADFKSAKKRSNLFCLRIANPQGRLTGSRFSLPPCGLSFPPLPKTKKARMPQ